MLGAPILESAGLPPGFFAKMWSSFCQKCMRFSPLAVQNALPMKITVRRFGGRESLKRFYKNVSISQGEGGFEVNLDKKKLKTPMGSLFKVPTEALALAVANEWQSQNEFIKRHSMHLTNLSNTAIDNPTHRERQVVIDGILEFLATDTVCYRLADPPELVKLQETEWDPLLAWVRERYDVEIKPTTGLAVPDVSDEALAAFRQHLESHSDWALVGYQNAVDILQSLILTSALVDRYLTVERAISLSKLEQEYQIAKWGNVEWHHDVDTFGLRARLAAATLFIHMSTEHTSIKTKDKVTRMY